MASITLENGQEIPVPDNFPSLPVEEQQRLLQQPNDQQQQSNIPEQLDISPTGAPPVQIPQPEQQAQAAEGQSAELKGRGEFLPLGVTQSGDVILAVPQAALDAFQTLKDVLDGKPVDPGKVAVDLGLIAAGGAPARLGTQAARSAVFRNPAAGGRATTPVPGTGEAVRQAGERIGVDLPPAVTSDITGVQQVGQVVSQAPVAGTPLVQASERAISQLGQAAERVEQGFGRGQPGVAGVKLQGALETHITERTTERIDDVWTALGDRLDQSVRTPLTETAKIAERITGERAEAALPSSGAVGQIAQALQAEGGLTFNGIKTLRTAIGQMIDNPSLLPSDMPRAELKDVYKALTKDLRNAATRAGGEEGRKGFDAASNFTLRESQKRNRLSQLLKADSPEKLVARMVSLATRSKAATSRADLKLLAEARRVVDRETWDELASATIANMGRDAEDNFSPNRFLTAWGNLSDGGKRILFQSTNRRQLAKALDDITEVSSRLKQLQQFANPSGTGRVGAATAFVGGLAGGAPLETLATTLGARVVADILAEGPLARTVANWAQLYERFAKDKIPREAMERATRVLAAEIATDQGAMEAVNQIAQGLEQAIGIGAPQATEAESQAVLRGDLT